MSLNDDFMKELNEKISAEEQGKVEGCGDITYRLSFHLHFLQKKYPWLTDYMIETITIKFLCGREDGKSK